MNCSVVRLRIGISKASIRLWASWTGLLQLRQVELVAQRAHLGGKTAKFLQNGGGAFAGGGTGTGAGGVRTFHHAVGGRSGRRGLRQAADVHIENVG